MTFCWKYISYSWLNLQYFRGSHCFCLSERNGNRKKCEFWGSHSNFANDQSHVGYDAVSLGK